MVHPAGGGAVAARRHSLLLAGAVTMLLAFAPRPSAAPVEAASSPAVVADTSSPTFASMHAPDRWVSGDLVGDANPVEVSAVLCRK
jgi:hypothetical protein